MHRSLRHKRIRKKIKGTSTCPRVCVFRSLKGMCVQIIDDTTGKTLASASHKNIPAITNKGAQAKKIGTYLAQEALKKNITNVVFDRSGYKYHGRVRALAEGAREGGLLF